MTRVGRVPNVALASALRGVVPLPDSFRNIEASPATVAVEAMINGDLRGPYRLWIAKGRAVHVQPERA